MNSSRTPPAHLPLTQAEIHKVFYGLMLGGFLSAVNQTIVASALPTIGRDLGDFQSLSWVIIAYLLSSTVVAPLYGKLSDIHLRRPVMLGGIAESPGVPPCFIPHCITLPVCCNRVLSNKLTYVSTSGLTTTYNYQFTLQNIGGSPLKYVGFAAEQSCVSFVPPLINLTLPAYGGPSLLYPSQSRTLTVQVQKTAPCPGSNYFYLSTFTSNLVACCSTRVLLPTNKCVILTSPVDGSVFLTNTAILAKAIPNTGVPVGLPCNFLAVSFYQDTVLVGEATHDPFQATFTPQVPGTYVFSAVATLENGEVQSSDPAVITIASGFWPCSHARCTPPSWATEEPLSPIGVSKHGQRLAALLSERSEYAMGTVGAHDPTLGADDVMRLLDLSEDQIAVAAAELEERRWVTLMTAGVAFPSGFAFISPTPGLRLALPRTRKCAPVAAIAVSRSAAS
jgi:MFS family permease